MVIQTITAGMNAHKSIMCVHTNLYQVISAVIVCITSYSLLAVHSTEGF